MTGGVRARDHLEAIAARPRPAGSAAEASARAHCARVLRAAGFEVREEPFEYSAFPGRYATSLGGLGSTLLLVAAAALAVHGRPGVAAALLAAGGTALAAFAVWAARIGVVRAPLMRRRGLNLTATRGTAPAVWLVAHLDSKSQPVPILVRAGAIVLHGATWAAALVLCAVEWLGAPVSGGWPSLGAVAVASGVPIVASVVGERSAGAVDNASGVAAVLLAAAALPRELSVGVLITSAEELGLAGARAWVRTRAPGTALNCDGMDDAGPLVCMYSGGGPPRRLVDAFMRVARAEGKPLAVRRLLPGVLVDGVAFADAGWEVLTLSRATVATLARVHTRRDSLELLSGVGVDDAVPLLARVTRELC